MAGGAAPANASPYPVVFVGSATEDLPFAQAVQQQLDHHGEIELWTEGAFVPSVGALPSLLDAAKRVDFAVMIVTALDTLSTRKTVLQVGRDNVLFEFGLFLGALGPERAFLLVDRAARAVLPTDLGGITPLNFDSRKTNRQSAVGAACTTIQSRMAVLGMRGKSDV